MIVLKEVNDYKITLTLLITTTLCLLINTYKVFMVKKDSEKGNGEELGIGDAQLGNWYSIETGLLVCLYTTGKLLQLYSANLLQNINTNNPSSSITPFYLLPIIISFTVLNSLKLWHFFEFNTFYLVSLLTTIHNQ